MLVHIQLLFLGKKLLLQLHIQVKSLLLLKKIFLVLVTPKILIVWQLLEQLLQL